MTKLAISVILKSTDLMKCTQQSLMQSLITCGELGLEPGGGLGYAYLVPYKNTCTAIIGYRGYIELARRSGKIASVNARVVHEKDRFTVKFGLEEKLEHEPATTTEPGRPRFVYCVAKFTDGGHHLEVMSMAEVEKIRDRNGPKKGGPWVTDFEEMAKKTVVRRAAKYWPLSAELGRALEADDEGEEVEGQVSGNIISRARSAAPIHVVDQAADEALASAPAEGEVVDGETVDPSTGEVLEEADAMAARIAKAESKLDCDELVGEINSKLKEHPRREELVKLASARRAEVKLEA